MTSDLACKVLLFACQGRVMGVWLRLANLVVVVKSVICQVMSHHGSLEVWLTVAGTARMLQRPRQ